MSDPHIKRHAIKAGLISEDSKLKRIPQRPADVQRPADTRRSVPGAPSRPGGRPNAARRGLLGAGLAGLLLLTLLAMPVANATAVCSTDNTFPVGNNGSEDFQGYTIGAQIPAGNCLVDDGDVTFGFVAVDPTASPGTNQVYFDNAGNNFNSGVRVSNACSNVENPTEGTIRYDFSFFHDNTRPAAGNYFLWGFVGAGTNAVAIIWDSAGITGLFTRSAAGTVSANGFNTVPAVPTGGGMTRYNGFLSIDPPNSADANCGAGTACGGITLSGNTYQVCQSLNGVAGGSSPLQPVLQFASYAIGTATYTGFGSYYDNITISGYPQTIGFNQVAVTDLTGYGMEPTGRTIISREDNGDTVKTYTATSLIPGGDASASTANCAPRFDGVLVVELEDTVYTNYVDCDGSGESNAIRIRNSGLGPPDFNCDQANQDNVNDGDTDIPNEIGEIGQILAMPINFDICQNGVLGYAAAAWSFTELNGKVGLYAVLYRNNAQDGQDKADIQLDTNPSPDFNQFCSWHNFGDGTDYVGAVTANGPIGIYEASAELDYKNTFVPQDVEVQLGQRFLNNGQYGSGTGLACAGNKVAILQADELHLVSGIVNGSSSPVNGFPIPITSTVDRGVAMTGSGRFIAYVDNGLIHIVWASNGTETSGGGFQLPTGAFRGMVFDNAGERLAVFTNDFITVYETSEFTCELSNTCAIEGGQGSDDNPNPTTSGTTTGGTGGGISGDITDSAYFWVFLWMAVALVLIAWLSYASRAGFPAIVYGIVAIVIYTMGVIFAGPDQISPWPLVAPTVISIGFIVARWR